MPKLIVFIMGVIVGFLSKRCVKPFLSPKLDGRVCTVGSEVVVEPCLKQEL